MTTRRSALVVLALAGFALFERRVHTQPQAASAAGGQPPLRQVAYIKASNTDPYDYFADGGSNQGHRGDSIALSRDGNTMAVGAPYESSAAKGINGNQADNSLYGAGAVYVFVRQGGTWVQQAYIKASNPGMGDYFGASLALSADGHTLVVAAYFESSAATGIDGNQNDDSLPQAGAVYVFTRTGTTWTQQAYLKASNTGRAATKGEEFGDGDQFGYSVAISGDGTTIAVGAASEDSSAQAVNGNQADDSQQSAGAVYVFTRAGSRWTQQAYLKGSYLEQGDIFGFSTALSFDGNTLVSSAFDERGSGRGVNVPHDNRANGSGALYVFTRQGTAWSQQAYIKGSRNEATDQLGYAVAISDDGNTIASGAGDEDCLTPGINPPGCENDSTGPAPANIWVGAAYVWVRTGAAWREEAFIKASNARPYNSFGVKLALSGDGNTLAVASYLEDAAGRGVTVPALEPFLTVDFLDPWRERKNVAEESGAVYYYTRTNGTWTERAYVKSSNSQPGHEFGSAVALSGDGRLMAVGAHTENSNATGINGNQADTSADAAGAVYVFTN